MTTITEEERAYRAALYEVDGIGPARFRVLMKFFKNAKTVWNASRSTLERIGLARRVVDELQSKKAKIDPTTHLKALASLGVRVVLSSDDEYPLLLKEIEHFPEVLFVRGRIHAEDKRALAVVGTRKPTPYGRRVTEKFVEQLVTFGITIVSGLARGIDGVAHRVALESGGRTLAVLGGGVDRVYPPEHVGMADEISRKGAVISEFAPGKLPVPGNFPARNRIISGLAMGVLVIEGAEKSGTKITASLAVEQNRLVFAVPGPITSRYSQAPADLLKLGAKAVTDVRDIVDELGISSKKDTSSIKFSHTVPALQAISEDEKQILTALQRGHISIDILVRETGKATSLVSSTLTLLELKGMVKHLGGMVYCLED